MDGFYLSLNGDTTGPFNAPQLRSKVHFKQIPVGSQFWREGMKEWASSDDLTRILGGLNSGKTSSRPKEIFSPQSMETEILSEKMIMRAVIKGILISSAILFLIGLIIGLIYSLFHAIAIAA